MTDAFFDISTHKSEDGYFMYQSAIAAVSIAYFRTTVVFPNEFWGHYLTWGAVLGFMAYKEIPYEMILTVEIASYALLVAWRRQRNLLLGVAVSIAISLAVGHALVSASAWKLALRLTPGAFKELMNYFLPISEMFRAYQSIQQFASAQKQFQHLFFVTFHIQAGMGFMGIAFLRREQHRRNLLIRMDVAETDDGELNEQNGKASAQAENGKEVNTTNQAKLERSRKFQRGAAPFILFTALPYMAQIIIYGNINKFAYSCLEHDLHRTVRVYELFGQDNRLTTLASETTQSPGGKLL